MTELRQAKVDGIDRHPAARGRRPGRRRRVLVIGWGSTYGPIAPRSGGCRAGGKVARAHLRHLNPFPANTGEVLGRYDRVLVPEMNLGQLAAAAAGPLPRRRRRATTR
jgi:2-oxoglutarate/2-oxoacid ferredoxin oxidoreductase subunit alpha